MDSYKNSDPRPPIMEGTPPPPEWRVPFIDWARPPWTRWAFQHIREILPSGAVACAEKSSDLPKALEPIEEISFEAEEYENQTVTIDAAYVSERLANLAGNTDLSKYIL